MILSVCLGLVWPASAIVTRHDTGYSRFLARESDYPAVFPLHVEQRRKTCVATLISQRWALTAAHCAEQTPLMAQLQTQGQYAVMIDGRSFMVDKLVFHPDRPVSAELKFSPDQTDLALIRLTSGATHVKSLPLYVADGELGQVMTFLGWGYSGIGATGISVNDGRLRFARNEVIRADRQLYFYFNHPDGPDSKAVEFEGIPGLGDSGGPALISVDGDQQLAGIAVGELESAGYNTTNLTTGLYGATVVYERISRHVDWIRQVIENDSATVLGQP